MILDMCSSIDILEVIYIARIMILFIKILVPIGLVVALSIELLKAIKTGNDDLLAKAKKNAYEKIIAAILVFLIPTFVNTILLVVGNNKNELNSCIENTESREILNGLRVEYVEKLVSLSEEKLAFSSYASAYSEATKIKDNTIKNDFLVRLSAVNQNIEERMERAKEEEKAKRISGLGFQTSGDYQTWKQCDSRWGSIQMGTSSSNICNIGCLVTSIAIQIQASGVKTGISNFNPGELVKKLNSNGGLDSNGTLYWYRVTAAIPSFNYLGAIVLNGETRTNKLTIINDYLKKGYYVVAEVKGSTGQHWVAVTGTTLNSVNMVDPASDAVDMWVKYDWNNTSQIRYFKAN